MPMESSRPVTTTLDWERNAFLSCACLLAGLGLLMVHSASMTSWPSEYERVYVTRHAVYLGLGILGATAAARISPNRWRSLAPWLYVLTWLLLLAVLVPGIGTKVNGAQRWLRWGQFSFQPSELAKLALPLYLAMLSIPRDETIGRATRSPWLVLPIAFLAPLILVEPDLGTTLFVCAGGALTLWVVGWPLRHFLTFSAVLFPAVAAMLVLKPYQRERLMDFARMWSDWSEAPYQLKQSLVTLGAGGVFGVGLGKGSQKLSFLPESNTDFVVAVIGEELGLVGTLGLLGLWGALYIAGLRLLAKLPFGSFRYVAGFVLLTQLVGQAFVNVAVVTGMVPTKGIPHPLVSYGGSNLVVNLLSLGVFWSLARPTDNTTWNSSGFVPSAVVEPARSA